MPIVDLGDEDWLGYITRQEQMLRLAANPEQWELTDGEQVIVLGNWAVIELVGPDTGEAFVQVPNDHDVLRVIRGNISSTRDGATWTGTNPLKEPT